MTYIRTFRRFSVRTKPQPRRVGGNRARFDRRLLSSSKTFDKTEIPSTVGTTAQHTNSHWKRSRYFDPVEEKSDASYRSQMRPTKRSMVRSCIHIMYPVCDFMRLYLT